MKKKVIYSFFLSVGLMIITYVVYLAGEAKKMASRELLRDALTSDGIEQARTAGSMARDAAYYDTYVIILLIITLCSIAFAIASYLKYKEAEKKG